MLLWTRPPLAPDPPPETAVAWVVETPVATPAETSPPEAPVRAMTPPLEPARPDPVPEIERAEPLALPPSPPPLAHHVNVTTPKPRRSVPDPSPARARPSVASSPAAAPPGVSAPNPEPSDPAILASWKNAVATWLTIHRTYPPEARRRGEEGNVVLRFTANSLGQVSDVSPVQSAGSRLLDDAAVRFLHSAALPAFPAGMPTDPITMTVQIRYALRN